MLVSPVPADSKVTILLEDMEPESNDSNDHWIEPDHIYFIADWLDDDFRVDWNDILDSKPVTPNPFDFKVSDLSMFGIKKPDGWYLCALCKHTRETRSCSCCRQKDYGAHILEQPATFQLGWMGSVFQTNFMDLEKVQVEFFLHGFVSGMSAS